MQKPLNLSPSLAKKFALFELGFRPFFLLASLFSVIATMIWMASYSFGWSLPVATITPIAWHGHEMVFGYSLAVIAGFLLTAVRNWTGVDTIRGLPLALLALTWVLARILPLFNSAQLFEWAALFDIAFFIGLIVAVFHPIAKVKQWRQLFIVGVLTLILVANILFYLGAFFIVNQGISWGLFSGVYLVMALVFTLARRVMPFFIERGVGYQVQLKNYPWIDLSSLLFLAALLLSDVFFKQALLTALLSLILTVIHSIRLSGWYTKGIWQKPLLWVLYLGYSLFILGFALQAINYFSVYPTSIPLHAFTYGGIGMMTQGMMSRITLGHTGRNINQPPKIISWVFIGLFLGTLIRVVMPIFVPYFYVYWIGTSQALWIVSFLLFFYHYLPILIRPRPDGKLG